MTNVSEITRAREILLRMAEIEIGNLESAHRDALDAAAVEGESEWSADDSDNFETDVTEDEFNALLPVLDGDGERPVELWVETGVETVDVRDSCLDSMNGPGYRAVTVRYEIELIGYVLGLRIEDGVYIARLGVVGGGTYDRE